MTLREAASLKSTTLLSFAGMYAHWNECRSCPPHVTTSHFHLAIYSEGDSDGFETRCVAIADKNENIQWYRAP